MAICVAVCFVWLFEWLFEWLFTIYFQWLFAEWLFVAKFRCRIPLYGNKQPFSGCLFRMAVCFEWLFAMNGCLLSGCLF